VQAGYAVITGGGPEHGSGQQGALEAAHLGRARHRAASNRPEPLRRPGSTSGTLRPQDHVREVRAGFIVLPGGFGTLDELFEAVTWCRPRKVTSFPLVLMGRPTGGLLTWLRESAAAGGTITLADIDLLHVTDDVDEAVSIIVGGDNDMAASVPNRER